MTFGPIARAIKAGEVVTRESWEGKAKLRICPMKTIFNSATNKVTKHLEYIEMLLPNREIIPWSPIHEDLLADDWRIL